MPRFCFNAHDGASLGNDGGRELPSEEAALREGLRLAAHLMSLEASRPKLGDKWFLEIADDHNVALFLIDVNVTRPVTFERTPRVE